MITPAPEAWEKLNRQEEPMSQEILSLSLRPKSLAGLVGQAQLRTAIRNQVAKRLPHSWLLSGASGTGKTTLARIIAVSLQCTHQKTWGSPCKSCLEDSWDIYETNAAESVGVAETKALADIALRKPMRGRFRVFILDEAQQISKQGQNLLLKPFEDAPETTIWIICTTEPNKILATLRRRCLTYNLKPLSIAGCEHLLKKAAEKAGVSKDLEPLFEQIHLHSVTSPGWLLMALEKYASGLSAEEAVATNETTANTFQICKAVTAGDLPKLRKELLELRPEQARWVRASVSGWLRGRLLKSSSFDRRSVEGIEALTANVPLEDAVLHHWLAAKLMWIAEKFR